MPKSPKGDKSPLKRSHKEVTETSSQHEKPTSSTLDTAQKGIKKIKVEPNLLQPEAALQQAFSQVAGKIQKDLREKTEANLSQEGDYNRRNEYKKLNDFVRLQITDNTNKFKDWLDHNPHLLKQSSDNNHDRIKYYLELGIVNPAAPGYSDKKGKVKYAQLKLEQLSLYKGITGLDNGVNESKGSYSTELISSGDKDPSNEATAHMEKWERYGESLKNGKLADNQRSAVFDHEIKSTSMDLGFCINDLLRITQMREDQKNQNQEKFNLARKRLLDLTSALKTNTADVDAIIRKTGHEYAQANNRTDIDIDKMISLASIHGSQRSEGSHIDHSQVSRSSDTNLTFGPPAAIKDELDFDI